SRLFDNADFGYSKIVVERPLRLAVQISDERVAAFKRATPADQHSLASALRTVFGETPCRDYNKFTEVWQGYLKRFGVKLEKKAQDLISACFAYKDENAEPVVKKRNKDGTVEYEPDTELRDTENVPLKESIEVYFEREVLPHVPDAWIDPARTQVG